jgi:uncharacterized BrkB/YihY/UPF0761 family membrane protein
MTDPSKASTADQTLSLDNQDSNLQTLNQYPPSKKNVNKIPTFMIWSILNLLLIPFGILCCYLSYKVRQFKMQNRYGPADKWSKRAFVGNIITTLLIFGVIITVVMLHYDYVQRNSIVQVNQTLTTEAYIPWQPGR